MQKRQICAFPMYEGKLCQCIGVLQNLQTLLNQDATLADVAQLIRDFQQEFGFQEELEYVIQTLVGRFLEQQIATRKQGLSNVRKG